MPLWKVYHPADAFSDADKRALAEGITDLYVRLPRFYVGIVFEEVPKESFFIGGKPTNKFVRISVDHIARSNLPAEIKDWWIENINNVLAPFVKDRGYDWEFHIDETPFDMWSIQGLRPPPANSEPEKKWKAENRPTPYEIIAATPPSSG
jgi:phenylpyruvate tautomerase PptA (4-oxalocrotonate tautomerase family)